MFIYILWWCEEMLPKCREKRERGRKRKEKGMEKRGGKQFWPGMHALAEIQMYQKSSDLLIRGLPFARYFLKYTLMQ